MSVSDKHVFGFYPPTFIISEFIFWVNTIDRQTQTTYRQLDKQKKRCTGRETDRQILIQRDKLTYNLTKTDK